MSANKSIVNEDSLVVKHQDEIHVFPNGNGSITILMKCWPDEDQMVVFQPLYAEAIISAIRNAVTDLEGS